MRNYVALQVLATGAAFCIAAAGAAAQRAAAEPAHVQVRGVVDGATVVETARQYLGVRYVLGGTTPRAFDCSGFVRYVFGKHGVFVPRTAHEQSALGRRPDTGDLQPGDLLFFYGGEGAQHIAMYIGRDSIIHASSGGHRVKIDAISGTGMHRTWFGQRLIAVRRLLPAMGVYQLPGRLALTAAVPMPGDDPFAPAAEPSLF